jgi:2-polyprenyl-3-methyl-5-hydroxy-6-metoxy-1,4-benzoquinol methylase
MSVKQFEEIVFSQKAVPAEHYDAKYFYGNWRNGYNNYSLEARRSIEGRNPHLIKEVFRPNAVLDFGCGPGVLIYLLHELGVYAEGIDFSPTAKQMAPEEIRDRILLMPIDGTIGLARQYDLVVCREVLEHLTVLQIQRAVENMCRLSSKFIYVTTRFSRRLDDFLAVEAEPHIDKSHISLLHKDFLRCLFILQGFRSRYDLEQQMDWKHYGRVLVLERAV